MILKLKKFNFSILGNKFNTKLESFKVLISKSLINFNSINFTFNNFVFKQNHVVKIYIKIYRNYNDRLLTITKFYIK